MNRLWLCAQHQWWHHLWDEDCGGCEEAHLITACFGDANDFTGIGIALLVFAVREANLLSAFVCCDCPEKQGKG